MLNKIIPQNKNITIILGHYGSGKSEVISNLILNSKKEKRILYDLDIINPYFRTNSLIKKFEENNIIYISGTVEGLNMDLPSIPNIKNDNEADIYIDLAGDSAGVKVLKGYKENLFPKDNCNFYMVINVNRPETKDEASIEEQINKIENELTEKITGIISNTHLLDLTSGEDIIKGFNIIKKISEKRKVPIIYVTYPQKYVQEEELILIKDECKLYPLDLNLRATWMNN